MSFMAVAYIPSYLEDHATYVKDRANGLYGPAVFMLANFIIGLPYLCMSPVGPQTTHSNNLTSPDRCDLLCHRLLAGKFPPNSGGIPHMDHVALPRSRSRRIACCPRLIHLPQLRNQSCFDGLRQRIMDVGGWVHGQPKVAERVLEIRLPLHRLSGKMTFHQSNNKTEANM